MGRRAHRSADRGRTPVPKPDLRRMLVPMGPIIVFGASNFPLAFSICGGDTASAFGWHGNPVVAKAHPAHPGTSEMAARVIQEGGKSNRTCRPGSFSMLQAGSGSQSSAGSGNPFTRAVGFHWIVTGRKSAI